MKIVEALKNLKTIQKRIQKNCSLISDYAGYLSIETPAFETPEKQRDEIQSLIQSNLDLENEYLRLKLSIEETNLKTMVTIGNFTYPISSLISIKRVAKEFRSSTYRSLVVDKAQGRLHNTLNRQGYNPQEPVRIIALYDEKVKNTALSEWEEFLSQIDGKLEVVNAETDLVNY